MRTTISLILLLCLSSLPLSARVQLSPLFTDNMVLQQQTNAPVWGKTRPRQTVSVQPSWTAQVYSTIADEKGAWKLDLPTPVAGGPYTLAFSDGGKKFTLHNVMVGEVWLCSGQSNMEMPLAGWGKINNYEQEVANATYPNIRLLHVEKEASIVPQAEIKGNGWQVCSPAAIAEFSSTAYFFGRSLFQNLNVPIGLIHSSWGGTPAEAWTSAKSLAAMPDFDRLPPSSQPPKSSSEPNVLYNGMVAPLVPFAIKGAIWYQGEANSARAKQYRDLFPLMVRDWRRQWNADFPFYFAQLASYATPDTTEDWAMLREAQLRALHLKNTGMAVTIDIGDAKDIHPKNKQDVGMRLALLARANAYGQDIVFSGPLFKDCKIEPERSGARRSQNNAVRISFTHANGGLRSRDGAQLKGFTIAGADHKFYEANAVIEGDEVVVSSPQVASPVAVRYAWANNPDDANLCNAAGLPASPFRTDDF